MSPLRNTISLVLAIGAIAGSADPAITQSVRVSVPEENFRKEPRVTSSNRLATVLEGAVLAVESRQGRWVRATLDGWIWSPSLSATDRDGFDLIVSNAGGENLREAPQGDARRVARLLRGMLVDRVEVRGSWTRVRRSAWLWSESTVGVEGAVAQASTGGDAGERDPGPETVAPARPAELPDRIVVSGQAVQLHVSPSGDTLASLRPAADLQVLARQGSWARVRLEGWVWVPSTLPADSAAAGGVLTPADVTANPDQFRGRQVRWRLQFVSVERAEPTRVDFYEGEPFILARSTDGNQGFVYVAVPPELLQEVSGLRPLQVIEVLGRIRTGRSALMGHPVLDLIALD
jgi:hypothetical protein